MQFVLYFKLGFCQNFSRKTGRAILQNQCCCEFAEIDYDKSVGFIKKKRKQKKQKHKETLKTIIKLRKKKKLNTKSI